MIPNSRLQELRASKRLLAVLRESIDDKKIQARLIDFSAELLLLEYVHDFRLDGLMLLRRQDVSEIQTRATDDFHQQLLETDGVLSKLPDAPYPIASYRDFLAAMQRPFFKQAHRVGALAITVCARIDRHREIAKHVHQAMSISKRGL